jgi:hypothetical protein
MTPRGTTGSGADVDAAVARWAAAAGVPVAVAQGYRSQTSIGMRFLRGFLLGCAVGVPLLALASVDGPADGLRLSGVLLVLWLGVRIQHRRQAGVSS